ncbi:MAG TPA: phage holin family protein [Myxococcota bacterium]|nr:phage holin family protein [Myxococcota bacterium]
MAPFLVNLLISAGLLLVVAHVVTGIEVRDWGAALLAALVLGVVNAVVRPILVMLTLPLTIVTLGLFLFVVNALMLQLAAYFVPGFKVAGFGAALLGSLLLTILNVGVSMLVARAG